MFYKSYKVELLMRIELATSSLPRKCSTTELQQQTEIIHFNYSSNWIIPDERKTGLKPATLSLEG